MSYEIIATAEDEFRVEGTEDGDLKFSVRDISIVVNPVTAEMIAEAVLKLDLKKERFREMLLWSQLQQSQELLRISRLSPEELDEEMKESVARLKERYS